MVCVLQSEKEGQYTVQVSIRIYIIPGEKKNVHEEKIYDVGNFDVC